MKFQAGGIFLFFFGVGLITFRNRLGKMGNKWAHFIKMGHLSYGESGWAALYAIFGSIFVVIGISNFIGLLNFT